MAFDVNDRSTWNWVDGGTVECKQPPGSIEYLIDPTSGVHFYSCSHGVPIRMDCAPGTVYSPWLKVCDDPANVTEADVYQWCVENGMVAPDQR
jgi:chitin binding peritrophin-A-like protein with CBM14 domain